MIFISRDQKDNSGNPIKPNDAWFETAKNHTDEAINEKENHNPQNQVYAHLQVKMALEKLFEKKCAYCESYLEESGWNVEHYRPKGSVAERGDHPGYYWLTYNWKNLFPSCISCNQKRIDHPTWSNRNVGETLGKADHFPIQHEMNRAMDPAYPLELEDPTLLNPCEEDPEEYITFGVLGDIRALIVTRKSLDSIKYFHLNRKRLKEKRQVAIKAAILMVEKIAELKKDKNPAYKDFENIFEKMCLADNCIFAASARCVKKYPDNFGIIIK